MRLIEFILLVCIACTGVSVYYDFFYIPENRVRHFFEPGPNGIRGNDGENGSRGGP